MRRSSWWLRPKHTQQQLNGNHDDNDDKSGQNDPRMATYLGDALTAYWQAGGGWSSPDFIRWLIRTGQLTEAQHVLQILAKAKVSDECRKDLRSLQRKLTGILAAGAPPSDLIGGGTNGSAPP